MLINLEFKRMCNLLTDDRHSSTCLCPECNLLGESVDQLIETRYRSFDHEGNESDKLIVAYDLTTEKIRNLKVGNSKYGFSAFQIEEALLDKFNVHVNNFSLAVEFQQISRVNPMPWETLSTITFNYIQVPGIEKMFRESSDLPKNIPQHLRDTLTYNDLLKHTFRSNVLVEYIGLMSDCIGFYKSPMADPINKHLEVFKSHLGSGTDLCDEKIAKIIRSLQCDLVTWSKAVIDEQGTSLFDFIEFLHSCAKTFYKNLRLDDRKFWSADSYELAYHLATYSEMIKLAGAVQERALKCVWGHLRRTTADLARVVQASLEK